MLNVAEGRLRGNINFRAARHHFRIRAHLSSPRLLHSAFKSAGAHPSFKVRTGTGEALTVGLPGGIPPKRKDG